MKTIKAISIFIFLLLSSYTHAAQILWDAGADTISWSDVNNWDCNCLPSANDTVRIEFSNVVLT